MNRLQQKNLSLSHAVRTVCVMALAMAFALSAGCAKNAKTQPASMRVLAKAKKPNQQPEVAEENESDDGPDYGGPAVLRKDLPLAGTKWAWEGNLSLERFESLDDQSLYGLEFKPNGWFEFQADCKHGTGIYEINGQRIALAVIKASRPACRPGSQADDFLDALEEGVKDFRQADRKLYFELKRGIKTMVFGLKP